LNPCLIDRQIGNDIADSGRLLPAPGGEFSLPSKVFRVGQGVRIDQLLQRPAEQQLLDLQFQFLAGQLRGIAGTWKPVMCPRPGKASGGNAR